MEISAVSARSEFVDLAPMCLLMNYRHFTLFDMKCLGAVSMQFDTGDHGFFSNSICLLLDWKLSLRHFQRFILNFAESFLHFVCHSK